MSGLEQAIRNALERADRANPDIRSRIYQSARNALDTGLRKQEVADPEVVERQRQRLEVTIRAVEDEELERLRTAARLEKIIIENAPNPLPQQEAATETYDDVRPETGRQDAPGRPMDASEDGSLSDLSASRDDAGSRPSAPAPQVSEVRSERHVVKSRKPARYEEEDPVWAEPSTPEGKRISAGKRRKGRKSGSILISLFVYSVMVGIVVAGVWWVYATGIIDAALNGSSDFDLIPKELQTEDFDPKANTARLDPLRGFSGDWVDIFKPGGDNTIKASAKVTVGQATDSDGAAVTIASNAPDQDGEVRIEVPAAILQDLAGKTSTIAVTVKADGYLPSQIYIQCEFTTLGDCGRHRYTVSNERVDELIQVKFDGKLGPNEPGYIVLNSDLTGDGRAIRLYGVRVLPGS